MEVQYGQIVRLEGGRLFQRELTAIDAEGDESPVTIEIEWVPPGDEPVRGVARLIHKGGRHEISLMRDDEWGVVLEGTFVIRLYLVRWAHDEGLRILWGAEGAGDIDEKDVTPDKTVNGILGLSTEPEINLG